jgi:hypothetical protein
LDAGFFDWHTSRHCYGARHEEGTQMATQTLALGSGTCRDFAALMMEALRSFGLAARFVTGYLYDDTSGTTPGRRQHACLVQRLFAGCRFGRCWLATAALLACVATVHNDMPQARRAKLQAVLKSDFGLDDLTAARLIEDSVAARRIAVYIHHFCRQLNETLNNEGRF